MSIFAIGDLHLSGEPPTKPMTLFGSHWDNHWQKIKASWLSMVTPEDAVIICGDTSWASGLNEALEDLQAISQLPGNKIILRGNHDYWWSTVKKMTAVTSGNFAFLHNNYYKFKDYAICGTRGWSMPGSDPFTEQDESIFNRECLRLEHSLSKAANAGCSNIIVALHYPPLYKGMTHSAFTDLCEYYKVRHCIFGHIHGNDHQNVVQGLYKGTEYRLVSIDYVNFTMQKIV